MNVPPLNERVSIEAKGVTRAADGGEVVTWSEHAARWARVQPLRGREFFAAGQMQDSIDYKVTVRYLASVARGMRVVWRGQALDIVSVIDVDGRQELLELMCSSGVRNASN